MSITNIVNFVVFENDGLIPLEAITSFGVSVKENKNPIGYFGTGAKYAVAIFLRLGCTVKLIRDGKEYVFSTISNDVRGESFDFICMNGEKLGFTTRVGKNWKAWQAFREFYCNALDENGDVNIYSESELRDIDKEGRTLIIVGGDEVMDSYRIRDKIVLKSKPIEVGEYAEAHQNTPDGIKNIYYRGIKVIESEENDPFYRWNITTNMELTEDRTLKYGYSSRGFMAQCVVKSENKDFIKNCIIKDGKKHMEFSLPYSGCGGSDDPSDEFMEVCSEAIESKIADLSYHAMTVYERINGKAEPEIVELDEFNKSILKKCVSFVEKIGYDVKDYPIKITTGLGKDVLGMAHKEEIWISEECFDRGKTWVAAALIEEYTHLKYGVKDETREMQTKFLLDIVKVGERFALGEAL